MRMTVLGLMLAGTLLASPGFARQSDEVTPEVRERTRLTYCMLLRDAARARADATQQPVSEEHQRDKLARIDQAIARVRSAMAKDKLESCASA